MMAGFSRLHRRYIGVIFFSSLFIFLILCCELILAWWYLHVSDFLLSLLRVCIRSSVSVIAFIHALHSFMSRIHIHLCATFTPVLHCIYSSLSIYQLRMCYTHSCVSSTHKLHSFMGYIHLCVPLILLFSCISYVASYPLTSFLLYHVSHTRLHTSLPVTSPYHVSNRMFSS